MVQVFDASPTESSASMIGKALGTGFSKQAGIADAESAFKQAQGDPFKLATAFARLTATSPELARGAGPMFTAMMNATKANAAKEQYGPGSTEQFSPGTREVIEQFSPQPGQPVEDQEAPGLTTKETAQEAIRPYIPRGREENLKRGVELLNENPLLYENDINIALKAAQDEDAANISRSRAIQAAGSSQQAAQTNLKQDLRDLNNKFGGGSIVPENVYNKIQNEAIESMLPKSEGGQGLTQQEASQKYIKKLDEIARDYKGVDDLGDWTFVWESPESAITNIENLRKKFEKNDDLENFADYLVGHNDLSPRMAYSQAFPVEKDVNVYKDLKKLDKLDPVLSLKDPTFETKKIIESLASKMDRNSSPLSIAHHLYRKGYDPQPFLNYLVENQDKLRLTAAQARQLSKGSQIFPKINDLYLMSQIGVE